MARVMVNVPEGTQRICLEDRLRLAKLRHVLLTRMTHRTVGGLPGLMLTAADVGQEALRVYGPVSQVNEFVDATRTFTENRSTQYTPVPVHADAQVVLEPRDDATTDLRILGTLLSDASSSSSPSSSSAPSGSHRPPLKRQRQGSGATCSLPCDPCSMTCSYVVVLPDMKGKFDVQRARALKLKPGPVFARLKAGETVECETKDGRQVTVRPEQVIGPSTEGVSMAILDADSIAQVRQLAACSMLQPYKEGQSRQLTYAVHFTPLELAASEEYVALLRSLGSHVQHVFMAADKAVPRADPHRTSRTHFLRLCRTLPEYFSPVDQEQARVGVPVEPEAQRHWSQLLATLGPEVRVYAAQHRTTYRISPPTRVNRDDAVDASAVYSPLSIDDERSLMEGFTPEHQDALAAAVKTYRKSSAAPPHGRAQIDMLASMPAELVPEVVFLGTGSALPSKSRNVSSIYLQINRASSAGVLMDAGEGTLGQLERRFGRARASEIVANLACVWISHMHADHHLGLVSLLHTYRRLAALSPRPPLLLIGPEELHAWLRLYESSTSDSFYYRFVACSALVRGGEGRVPSLLSALSLTRFECVPVIHCPESYALVLEHTQGWSLVYSGDTRPCPELAEACPGATLLIHEATLENSMQDLAVAKKHSTTGEALAIAQAMRAERVLLTHFSQRYPKVPELRSLQDSQVADRACIAFDLMHVSFKHLRAAPAAVAVLSQAFPAPTEQDEDGVTDRILTAGTI